MTAAKLLSGFTGEIELVRGTDEDGDPETRCCGEIRAEVDLGELENVLEESYQITEALDECEHFDGAVVEKWYLTLEIEDGKLIVTGRARSFSRAA